MTASSAPVPASYTRAALLDLYDERVRQNAKHGDQTHLPDGTGPTVALDLQDVPFLSDVGSTFEVELADLAEWAKARTKAASQNEGGDGSITYEMILTEEWAEAIAEADPVKLRAELVQVAAVAVAWIEKLDQEAAS